MLLFVLHINFESLFDLSRCWQWWKGDAAWPLGEIILILSFGHDCAIEKVVITVFLAYRVVKLYLCDLGGLLYYGYVLDPYLRLRRKLFDCLGHWSAHEADAH